MKKDETTYMVKEIFATLQGEGRHAGVPSVFVRFAGCNLWSGIARTRIQDARRKDAVCPAWCDTDFHGGRRMTARQIAETVRNVATEDRMKTIPHIVFTGGEPLLQLDAEVISEVYGGCGEPRIAVETNGSILPAPAIMSGIDWITVSPKQMPVHVKLRSGDELKVVWPESMVDPEAYAEELGHFDHYYLSPLASLEGDGVGKSLVVGDVMRRAAKYCMRNPRWTLSVQTHKVIGLQ